MERGEDKKKKVKREKSKQERQEEERKKVGNEIKIYMYFFILLNKN